MSFFTELYALAQHTALTLQIVADEKTGRMTINVKPKVQKDTAEPALATALSTFTYRCCLWISPVVRTMS